MLTITCELNDLGRLSVKLTNIGNRLARFREVLETRDVRIVNDMGEAAEFYLSFPYGCTVSTADLNPGQSRVMVVNLAEHYIYPRNGKYAVWIEYDSTIPSAPYDRQDYEQLKIESNRVSIRIGNQA